MKLDKAIEAVRDAEAELARRLRSVGERHALEADVYHLGHTLARQCAEHVRRLEPFAERYGAGAGPDDLDDSPGALEALRRKGAELLGRTEVSGPMLLHDLRQLYMTAHDSEITWVMLVQAARAARDAELIEVARECCEEADGRVKWVRTKIKEASPQVFVAG